MKRKHYSAPHVQKCKIHIDVKRKKERVPIPIMGIARAEDQCETAALEELRRISEQTYGRMNRRKDPEEFDGRKLSSNTLNDSDEEIDDVELVCVTSGVSFLGLAVVNQLLLRRYSVRIIIDNPEDEEKLREMKSKVGGNGTNNVGVSTVSANLREYDSLMAAFDGCHAVFHTSAFVDPAGLTGYSKSMADIEKMVSENVMEACARTASVRYCVFTSSLLACIWRHGDHRDLPPVVNHDCWSDQSLCIDNKLWYALGKLRAEKAAWRIAKERDLKLATLCPALITAPELNTRNPTPTIAYLKGAEKMFENGLLATVDVTRLAEAHVNVYEAMVENKGNGRYICFDQIISTTNEAQILAAELGFPITKFCQEPPPSSSSSNSSAKFQLSNKRLSDLTSARPTRCNFQT